MNKSEVKFILNGFFVFVCIAQTGCTTGRIQRQPGAVHSQATPFDALHTPLQLTPGQTYLSFMMNRVKPGLDSYEDAVTQESKSKPNQYSLWQTDLLAQGDGVAIRIDPKNYILNIGYLNGSDPVDDIKSGRSYGVGPTNRESDPSDEFYLNELESYLKSEPNSFPDFYRAIMQVLTNCDSSGWGKLSDTGQIVATDFLAIYTAESDRHIMVHLRPSAHPWEIDLAAATFVSVFDVTTGKIVQNLKLTDGRIGQWWAKGNAGSGIGETRKDRIALQEMIAKYEMKTHPDLIKDVDSVIGQSTGDDVIQGVLDYLNAPAAPMNLAGSKGQQLTDDMVNYLGQIQRDADEITKNN